MLIINAKLVTWEKENRILDDHAILIENDRIKEIGKSADLLKKYPHEEKLDARGQYVMPGNIRVELAAGRIEMFIRIFLHLRLLNPGRFHAASFFRKP
mgnify:CR=1 FL=1